MNRVTYKKKERKKKLDIRLCHLDDIDPAAGFLEPQNDPRLTFDPRVLIEYMSLADAWSWQ